MLIVLWILVSVLVGFVASAKGRSAVGWFFISLMFSPLIALLALCAVPDKRSVYLTVRERGRLRAAHSLPASRSQGGFFEYIRRA